STPTPASTATWSRWASSIRPRSPASRCRTQPRSRASCSRPKPSLPNSRKKPRPPLLAPELPVQAASAACTNPPTTHSFLYRAAGLVLSRFGPEHKVIPGDWTRRQDSVSNHQPARTSIQKGGPKGPPFFFVPCHLRERLLLTFERRLTPSFSANQPVAGPFEFPCS